MESIESQFDAHIYHEMSNLPRKVGVELISRTHTKKGAKVLDLGCGPGMFSPLLADLVGPEGKVMAIDPDSDMIKVAKEKNARANIEYLIGSDRTFPGDEFDVVFSSNVIHWVSNKKAFFERIFEKLCVGGSFLFSTVNGRTNFPPATLKLLDLLHPQFVDKVYYKRVFVENLSTYRNLALSVGFKVAITDELKFLIEYESAESLLDWYIASFPRELKRSSIDRDALMRYKQNEEENLKQNPIPVDMLFVELVKP